MCRWWPTSKTPTTTVEMKINDDGGCERRCAGGGSGGIGVGEVEEMRFSFEHIYIHFFSFEEVRHITD